MCWEPQPQEGSSVPKRVRVVVPTPRRPTFQRICAVTAAAVRCAGMPHKSLDDDWINTGANDGVCIRSQHTSAEQRRYRCCVNCTVTFYQYLQTFEIDDVVSVPSAASARWYRLRATSARILQSKDPNPESTPWSAEHLRHACHRHHVLEQERLLQTFPVHTILLPPYLHGKHGARG